MALVGLGEIGLRHMEKLLRFPQVEVRAVCDTRAERLELGREAARRADRPEPEVYLGEEAFRDVCARDDLDLVFTAAPWTLHVPVCLEAMHQGKHAVTEVPAATTLEECRLLVETSERTGLHCVMLENCCYDFFELQTLNMVRQGVFGELTHAEGAYIHSLVDYMQPKNGEVIYQDNWRLAHNLRRNGNLYPTHGLGPVAQCLDINRGNRFLYLTSMSSQQAAFTEHARRTGNLEFADLPTYRGDMNTTLIKCARGQTVMIQHDTSTPRAYSRIHLVQGSLGMARKVGGHGGMDFIMDYRLIYCLKNGLPLDQDVYDAATWSSVSALSCESVAHRSGSVDVPDFTRGTWENNQPLQIVDVDPALLPLLETAGAREQLELR